MDADLEGHRKLQGVLNCTLKDRRPDILGLKNNKSIGMRYLTRGCPDFVKPKVDFDQ